MKSASIPFFLRGPTPAELLTGLLMGAVLAMAVGPSWLRGRERAALAQAQDRMRATAIALESYRLDHEFYPACGAAVGRTREYPAQQLWQPPQRAQIEAGVLTINAFASQRSGAARLVTFRLAGGRPAEPDSLRPLASLTTPVPYLLRFETDPFAGTRGGSLGYFAHASNMGWILFSLGPDRDENAPDGPGQISPRVERLYDIVSDFPYMWNPPAALIDVTYDPTNGLWSRGDLYRVQGRGF